jgi:hypothetical protein
MNAKPGVGCDLVMCSVTVPREVLSVLPDEPLTQMTTRHPTMWLSVIRPRPTPYHAIRPEETFISNIGQMARQQLCRH